MKLIQIEQAAVEKAVMPWKKQVDDLKEQVLILYTLHIQAAEDPADAEIFLMELEALLNKLVVPSQIDEILLNAVKLAHLFGIETARQGMEEDATIPDIPLSKNSQRAIEGMEQLANDAIRQTREKLMKDGSVESLAGVLDTISPLTKNGNKMKQAATWAINNAHNSAISKIALRNNETFHWVSERDGCVHCLAYSGRKGTKTGFPKGLSYAEKPLAYKGTLAHPPLHPNCRCEIEIGLSDEYAKALEREADRSILRGDRMPSESEAVRLRAAKRLAESNPDMPKSVIKYAKDAVKRGSFDNAKK